MIDPFKNLQVNLQAAGPAAVLCVLFICVAAIGIFGQGSVAHAALTVLTMLGVGVVATLALRS